MSRVRTVKIDDTRALVVYAGAPTYCRARIATVGT